MLSEGLVIYYSENVEINDVGYGYSEYSGDIYENY